MENRYKYSCFVVEKSDTSRLDDVAILGSFIFSQQLQEDGFWERDDVVDR